MVELNKYRPGYVEEAQPPQPTEEEKEKMTAKQRRRMRKRIVINGLLDALKRMHYRCVHTLFIFI